MAEVLVKAIDHVHPDPKVDRQGAYKAGDPVVIMEDGHQWGRGEGPPKFQIVKFPGIPAKDMMYLIESGAPNLRDMYPRAFLQIKRLLPSIRKEAVNIPPSIRRKRKIDLTTKQILVKPQTL